MPRLAAVEAPPKNSMPPMPPAYHYEPPYQQPQGRPESFGSVRPAPQTSNAPPNASGATRSMPAPAAPLREQKPRKSLIRAHAKGPAGSDARQQLEAANDRNEDQSAPSTPGGQRDHRMSESAVSSLAPSSSLNSWFIRDDLSETEYGYSGVAGIAPPHHSQENQEPGEQKRLSLRNQNLDLHQSSHYAGVPQTHPDLLPGPTSYEQPQSLRPFEDYSQSTRCYPGYAPPITHPIQNKDVLLRQVFEMLQAVLEAPQASDIHAHVIPNHMPRSSPGFVPHPPSAASAPHEGHWGGQMQVPMEAWMEGQEKNTEMIGAPDALSGAASDISSPVIQQHRQRSKSLGSGFRYRDSRAQARNSIGQQLSPINEELAGGMTAENHLPASSSDPQRPPTVSQEQLTTPRELEQASRASDSALQAKHNEKSSLPLRRWLAEMCQKAEEHHEQTLCNVKEEQWDDAFAMFFRDIFPAIVKNFDLKASTIEQLPLNFTAKDFTSGRVQYMLFNSLLRCLDEAAREVMGAFTAGAQDTLLPFAGVFTLFLLGMNRFWSQAVTPQWRKSILMRETDLLAAEDPVELVPQMAETVERMEAAVAAAQKSRNERIHSQRDLATDVPMETPAEMKLDEETKAAQLLRRKRDIASQEMRGLLRRRCVAARHIQQQLLIIQATQEPLHRVVSRLVSRRLSAAVVNPGEASDDITQEVMLKLYHVDGGLSEPMTGMLPSPGKIQLQTPASVNVASSNRWQT